MTSNAEIVQLSREDLDSLAEQIAKRRASRLKTAKEIVDDVLGRINKHAVFTALIAWELLFWDKHAKDPTPDSIIEIIRQLLSAGV